MTNASTPTAAAAALRSTPRSADGFLPIAAYGLIVGLHDRSTGRADGSIDWLCLPRFDGPACSPASSTADAGHWPIAPREPFQSERRYLPARSCSRRRSSPTAGPCASPMRWPSRTASAVTISACDAPHELLRLVEGVEGDVELELELAPRPEYGLVRPLFRQHRRGRPHVRRPEPDRCALPGFRSSVDRRDDARDVRASRQATQVGFALRWAAVESAAPAASGPRGVAARIGDTAEAWRSWEAEHDGLRRPAPRSSCA